MNCIIFPSLLIGTCVSLAVLTVVYWQKEREKYMVSQKHQVSYSETTVHNTKKDDNNNTCVTQVFEVKYNNLDGDNVRRVEKHISGADAPKTTESQKSKQTLCSLLSNFINQGIDPFLWEWKQK